MFLKKYRIYGMRSPRSNPEYLYVYWDDLPQSLNDLVDRIWASDPTVHRVNLIHSCSDPDFISVNNLGAKIDIVLTAIGSKSNRFALVLQNKGQP
jgi:hypothetical protein